MNIASNSNHEKGTYYYRDKSPQTLQTLRRPIVESRGVEDTFEGDSTGRLKMKTDETQIRSLISVISIAVLLFWAGAVVYAYVADDRSAAPADERSVPAPRSY